MVVKILNGEGKDINYGIQKRFVRYDTSLNIQGKKHTYIEKKVKYIKTKI